MRTTKQIRSKGGLLTTLFLTLSLFLGTSAFAFGPNPDEVFIAGIAYGGTGCRQGSVGQMLAPDAQAFTLIFDEYVAEAGPNLKPSDARKSCQIALDLRFPQGWSFTIFTVDYRGYANLDPGTYGVQQSNYYFQGSQQNATLQSTFRGPFEDDYQIRDILGIDALVWSPCGETRTANIKTMLKEIAKGKKRALMTVDSIDGVL